jgi:hypothetical protein
MKETEILRETGGLLFQSMKMKAVLFGVGALFGLGVIWIARTLSVAHSRLIDLSRLLPGDIILTRPHEKDSKFIAMGTMGPFSHAQIVLLAPWVLEATYDQVEVFGSRLQDFAGVRLTILHPFATLKRKPRQTIEVFDTREHKRFEVLRYFPQTQLQRERLEAFRAEPRPIIEKYLGEMYASPETLLTLTPVSEIGFMRPLLEQLLAEKIPPPRWEGFFCSQLAMQLYQDAGLPLYDAPTRSTQVTPNDLWRDCSRLKPVTSTLFVPLTQRERYRLRFSLLGRITRSPAWTSFLVGQNVLNLNLQEGLTRLHDVLTAHGVRRDGPVREWFDKVE